ncbi:MAG: hypothetical protein JW841_06380 [Deltaproteobacteria bacterium]|nr:hypothetical protein [Deltaproteobacteria bacterium]
MTTNKRHYSKPKELPLFSAAARAKAMQSHAHDLAEPMHVSCGLASLDISLNGGFTRGTVTLCAGRPRVGTSSLLIGIALSACKRGESTAILSESVSARQMRGRIVLLEAKVNGYRVSAGLISPEDRIAIASANERLPWQFVHIYARNRISAADIHEHIKTYRPWYLLADLQPRPEVNPVTHDPVTALALGVENLKTIARQHHVAIVVRYTMPIAHGRPNRGELPGLGAYAEAFDTVLLLHRGDDADDEMSLEPPATLPGRIAEVQIVRHDGKDCSPIHIKLHFDQRYAAMSDWDAVEKSDDSVLTTT